jgi:hypothetical protein
VRPSVDRLRHMKQCCVLSWGGYHAAVPLGGRIGNMQRIEAGFPDGSALRAALVAFGSYLDVAAEYHSLKRC